MQRHSRQSRLADVGPEGQGRIARAAGVVPGRGLEAEVAARYLAGAGVGVLRVGDEAVAASAQAVDPGVQVVIDASLAPVAGDAGLEGSGIADPACRAVAAGAMRALRAVRAALETEPS